MRDVPHFRDRGSPGFDRTIAPFLSHEGLPFASVLSADRSERGGGNHGDAASSSYRRLKKVLGTFFDNHLRLTRGKCISGELASGFPCGKKNRFEVDPQSKRFPTPF